MTLQWNHCQSLAKVTKYLVRDEVDRMLNLQALCLVDIESAFTKNITNRG